MTKKEAIEINEIDQEQLESYYRDKAKERQNSEVHSKFISNMKKELNTDYIDVYSLAKDFPTFSRMVSFRYICEMSPNEAVELATRVISEHLDKLVGSYNFPLWEYSYNEHISRSLLVSETRRNDFINNLVVENLFGEHSFYVDDRWECMRDALQAEAKEFLSKLIDGKHPNDHIPFSITLPRWMVSKLNKILGMYAYQCCGLDLHDIIYNSLHEKYVTEAMKGSYGDPKHCGCVWPHNDYESGHILCRCTCEKPIRMVEENNQ